VALNILNVLPEGWSTRQATTLNPVFASEKIFERIKAGGKGGNPGQWSARKAQMLAQQYKKSGGGYRD
jgi:hypothetical protein